MVVSLTERETTPAMRPKFGATVAWMYVPTMSPFILRALRNWMFSLTTAAMEEIDCDMSREEVSNCSWCWWCWEVVVLFKACCAASDTRALN